MGSLKRKSIDQSATLKALLEGRRHMTVDWLNGGTYEWPSEVAHHHSLAPIVKDWDYFIAHVEAVYGLHSLATPSDEGSCFLGSAAQWRFLFDSQGLLNTKPHHSKSSGMLNNPSVSRKISYLPPCAASVLNERSDMCAGIGDLQWEKVRDGVRKILEEIFSPFLLVCSGGANEDADDFRLESSALARGAALAAEIEEELYYFNVTRR